MKKSWVRDLKPGMEINDLFVLRKKELRDYEGGNFLKLELGDKTGRVNAVVWNDAVNVYRSVEEGEFLQVRGFTTSYRNDVQIRLDSFTRVKPEQVELTDFLPHSKTPPENLLEIYKNEAAGIRDSNLKQLLQKILEDQQIVKGLTIAPGGKLWHHNYVGGLLEHTLKIVEICKKACELYPTLDRDLLITAALLHDIGKISQYQVGSFIDYSDEGRLIGHIVEGDRIVSDKIKQMPEFPEVLAMKLRHLILSHQGELQMGSPVVPQTLEAIVLHNADEMDAKVGAFMRIIESEQEPGKKWSSYVKLIDRYIYLGEQGEKKE
ncbi:hypothetical protein A2W24_03650 [Microgenomates group bacterium RBG_16_45_19]|nr:MAG: hypothetical protein A2W24_03650 [Microgenomates group bacterium RBG_16_45_19]